MGNSGKALVTGGAGFIGSHLVDRLVEEGFQVLVIDNLATGFEENINPKARFENVDITGEQLTPAFERWKPDFVFHLAAQANVRLSIEDPLFDTAVNAMGTLKVLENCRSVDVGKLVFSSTGGAIYGEPEQLPCSEDHPCNPLSLYGVNKLVAEHYLSVYSQAYGLRSTTVRFANIFGPRQNPHGEAGVVAIFAEKMLRGERVTIFGDGSKTRDYVYVGDAVNALMISLNAGNGKVFNVGRGEQISDQQVFDTVASACGHESSPVYDEVRPGEVYKIALDASLIEKELGWRGDVAFREGVEQTVPYYRKKLSKSPLGR